MGRINVRSDYLVVLLPTYNRLELLKKAIASIASGTRCSHEIIVIDGGSTDGTIEYLKSHPGVTPVLQGRLLGTARCHNEVWRQVECKYTCFLSDDNEIADRSLDLAVRILESDPEIGLVGLKMKDTMGYGKHRVYMGSIAEYGILNCNQSVFRMETLRSLGYFNEAYRSYNIDTDLTASVLCAGRRVVMTKPIGVLHHRAWAEEEEDVEEKVRRDKGGIDNLAIYREKFRFLQSSVTPAVRLKSMIAHQLGRLLFFRAGPSESATRLGLSRRDWYNITYGRFIRLTDPLENRGRPYHLVQRLPRWLLMSEGNPYRHLVGAG